MSGTNQSNSLNKQERMDLSYTSNLNSSISNNEKDVTPHNSNIHLKTVPDDEEGNLQIQIQEAVAATIRASRNSIGTDEQETSNSGTEVLHHNAEMDDSNDSSSSKYSSSAENIDDCTSSKPIVDNVQPSEEVSEEKSTQEPLNSEVSSSQENCSRESDSDDGDDSNNKHSEDAVPKSPQIEEQVKRYLEMDERSCDTEDVDSKQQTDDEDTGQDSFQSEELQSTELTKDLEEASDIVKGNEPDTDSVVDDGDTPSGGHLVDTQDDAQSKDPLEIEENNDSMESTELTNDLEEASDIAKGKEPDADSVVDEGDTASCSEILVDTQDDAQSKDPLEIEENNDAMESKELADNLTMDQDQPSGSKVDEETQDIDINSKTPAKDLEMDVEEETGKGPAKDLDMEVEEETGKGPDKDLEMDVEEDTGKVNKSIELEVSGDQPNCVEVFIQAPNEDTESRESTKDVEMDETSCTKGDVDSKLEKEKAVEHSAESRCSEDDTGSKDAVEDNKAVKSRESTKDLEEDQTSCSKGGDDRTLEKQNENAVEHSTESNCSKDDTGSENAVEDNEAVKSQEPAKNLENGDKEDVQTKEPAEILIVGEGDQLTEISCSKDNDGAMDTVNGTETPDPLALENDDEVVDSTEDIQHLLMEPEESSCGKDDDDNYFVSMNEVQNIIKDTQVDTDASKLICNETLPTQEQEKATSKNTSRNQVFPVIEIVEDDNADVVEVIDVDASNPIRRRKIINRPVFKNRLAGGACIEILSDEEEAQDKVVVVDQQSSAIQQAAKQDAIDFQKTQLEGILQEVKMLTSSEYLLFYLKLPPKWEQDKTSPINPTDTINSKLESKELIIPERNEGILKAISASVKDSSKDTVQNIVDRVLALTVKEFLWLRCYLPTHCVNPSLQHCLLPHGSASASQTVLWLKSHLEEVGGSLMLKQEVFNTYVSFCAKNSIPVLSSSRFGKLINQVYPNIGRKRLRAKGNSAYYYVGLQSRCKLDTPRLPKLQQKSGPPTETMAIKCEVVTEIQPPTPKPKPKPKSKPKAKPTVPKEIVTEIQQNAKPKATPTILNGMTNLHRRKRIVETETDGSYRSNELDGQTILIHDPLALLDISISDNTAPNDATHHQTASAKNHKYTRTTTQMHNHCSGKYTNLKPPAVNSGVRKGKYREYKHPSVQKVSKTFNTIVLPTEIYRFNINPAVSLDNTEMNNWYAERLVKHIQKLKNIVVRKPGRSPNFNVAFACCNDMYEISDSYAKQLNDLKTNLSNVVVEKTENNYKVVQTSVYNPVVETPQTFRITKLLTNPNVGGKSVSVQKLSHRFKNVVLPEEVLKSNIDPVIVLNSGEVINWYIQKLDALKHGKVVANVNDAEPSSSAQRSRHTKAKMMNFCEIDSSDDEDNRPVAELKYIPDITKQEMVEIHQVNFPEQMNVPEVQTNELVAVTIQAETIQAGTIQAGTIQAGIIPAETVEQVVTGQKRVNQEEANEIEQKRKRFYCSKIVVSPNFTFPEALTINKVYMCPFCASEFDTKANLAVHKKEHLFCKSCKRKLRNVSIMMEHLMKHCSLNTIKNKPRIKLQRIDSIPSMLKKYADAFKEPPPIYNVIDINPVTFSPNNLKRTYSKTPRNTTTVRILQPGSQIPENQEIFYSPTPEQPTFELKNTISNNLNKILLLSNNGSPTQMPSSNIVYGTLYVNNSNGPASPQICLNSSMYNPTASTSVDCAMSSNPSCSNDLQQPPTFMQIVESPNTSVMQYATPLQQHQDHSYHQQQLYQVGGNMQNMNNIVFVSSNVPPLTEIESTNVNTYEESENTESSERDLLNTDDPNNAPSQGQFKIRVKSIQELR